MEEYLPELKGSGYEGVKVKDVLQMSSGVKFNEDYGDPSSDINRWFRAFALGDSQDEFAEISMNSISLDDAEHLMDLDDHHKPDNTDIGR